jgi:phage portal protein BeeE
MQHQVETICRFFGVPPHKVQHLLRSTFSNIEHQSIEVVVDSIAPWAKLLEEEADFKLFGRTNRQGYFTKIYLQGLMRGDAKSRGEFYKLMFETGAFSPNMILQFEDQNPIGPDGDKHMVQSQYTTLERIGEEPVETVTAPVTAVEPDEPDEPKEPQSRKQKRKT